MKKTFQTILSTAAAIMILFSLLVSVTEAVCLNSGWFAHEFDRHEVSGVTDPVERSDEMMNYLFGRAETPDSGGAFFNNRELHHLADCRALFTRALRLRSFAMAAALIIFAALIIKKRTALILRSFKWTSLFSVAAAAVFIAVFAVNFDASYDRLHESLFDNYLWIMNPATDNLVHLMSVEIISETAALILGLWICSVLLLCLLCSRLLKKQSSSY